MASPTPLPTSQAEIANLIAQETKALSPEFKARFLACAAVFAAIVVLMTYGSALAGNHLAQHYLEIAAVPVGTFFAGWLGIPSPFVGER